jgi:hypothetical protein
VHREGQELSFGRSAPFFRLAHVDESQYGSQHTVGGVAVASMQPQLPPGRDAQHYRPVAVAYDVHAIRKAQLPEPSAEQQLGSHPE